jgi:hypothetical protein
MLEREIETAIEIFCRKQGIRHGQIVLDIKDFRILKVTVSRYTFREREKKVEES